MRHGRIFLRFLAALLAILASGFSAGSSLAQDGTEPPLPIRPEPEMEEAEEELPEIEPQEAARPIARAARIETREAPIIDGDLSDLAWAKATVIDDIRQRQPDPGAPRDRADRGPRHVRRQQSLLLRLRL